MDDLELEVKRLIVSALKLEDLSPEEIDSEESLFADGLGLDSIDALEIGVALRQAFGIKLEAATEEVKAHFANVRSLARFVAAQKVG
jgi:acyl carrier protein